MDLLGRARKMLKGIGPADSARPQYYSVSCPQGHSLRGLRTEGYQALRCPTCGDGIFILPRSPLPEPASPPARSRATHAPASRADWPDDAAVPLADPPAQDADDVIWLDEAPENARGAEPSQISVSDDEIPPEYLPTESEEEEDEGEYALEEVEENEASPPDFSLEPVLDSDEPEADEVAEPQRSRHGRAAGDARPSTRDAEEEDPDRREVSVLEKSGGLGDWGKRHKVPLLLLSVVALVVSTFAYRLWRQHWENLPHEAEVNFQEGAEALELGEFDSAKRKLGIAARAFERLGIDDKRARESRQMADEAAILADRASRTLEEMVEEAARYDPPEQWPSRFETIYRGQAIIVDSEIATEPAHSPSGSYELTYRIFVGRPPGRRGRIDLKGFRLFETLQPVKSQRVTFGARLTSLTLDGNEWVVGLEPNSGVIMTHQKALEKTEWTPLAEEPAQAAKGGRP